MLVKCRVQTYICWISIDGKLVEVGLLEPMFREDTGARPNYARVEKMRVWKLCYEPGLHIIKVRVEPQLLHKHHVIV